ncbi:MAG: hypothetical protein JWP87_831 [Labilithrix sp.]|nr:hypothetical protein [Labilithrix sp.]
MSHPSNLDLEAFAVGEPLRAEHARHVEECAACGAFLEELRGVVATGPTAKKADDAVARAMRTMGASEREREREPEALHPKRGAANRKLWVLTTSVLAPLAAAAAIVLSLRSAPPPVHALTPANEDPEPAVSTTMKIQMGTFPSAVAEPDTRFKGGMQLAVVRARGEQQVRFSPGTRTVHVRPGDRIRVEVALDREQAILGAVLADDGSYLEIMPEAVRGPGTHYSERSAKIDAAPTHGTILIGTPEAVAHARATRQLDGVTTLRVDSEKP